MSKSETGIHIIPPLVFLATFVLAWLVHWLFPLGLGLPMALRWLLGAILILGPLAVIPHLFTLFRRAGSEYDIRKVPKGLVTEGLFCWSRNPGYVALIVLGVGVAILFDNLWVLLLIVPATIIVRREVVLKEEALLEREFGEEYRHYKSRVRRWI
jgi:protein-S-isoprenylcysteine O-methyltransferase Ste14